MHGATTRRFGPGDETVGSTDCRCLTRRFSNPDRHACCRPDRRRELALRAAEPAGGRAFGSRSTKSPASPRAGSRSSSAQRARGRPRQDLLQARRRREVGLRKCEGARRSGDRIDADQGHGAQRTSYENGTIMDPRDGSVYHALMELSPDGKKLDARLSRYSLFGRSQLWNRLPDNALGTRAAPKGARRRRAPERHADRQCRPRRFPVAECRAAAVRAPGQRRHRRIAGFLGQDFGAVLDAHDQHQAVGVAGRDDRPLADGRRRPRPALPSAPRARGFLPIGPSLAWNGHRMSCVEPDVASQLPPAVQPSELTRAP